MKIFAIFGSIVIYTIACFMDDPKFLFQKTVIEELKNGYFWQVEFPYYNPEKQNSIYWYDGLYDNIIKQYNLKQEDAEFYKYADFICTFPLTINCNFISNDNAKITKIILLYWNKNHKWSILKQINNPNYVINNDTQKKALFGKYVFSNSMGFKKNQILFIYAYFETQNGNKTHDNLTSLLTTSNINNLPHKIDGVIRIGISDNKKPIIK